MSEKRNETYEYQFLIACSEESIKEKVKCHFELISANGQTVARDPETYEVAIEQ